MRLLIERTIELLKLQVRENLQVINENQSKILELLKLPVSEKKKAIYEECYGQNIKLLSENSDFISMQLTLRDFLEKHKESPALQNDVPEDFIEVNDDENIIFEMTVNDELKYDKLHPLFEDDVFFNKLIRYYTSIEAYEKCSELFKSRKIYISSK